MTRLDATLPDGRKVYTGKLYRVNGRNGWFTFLYGYDNNDDLTLYGPINGNHRKHISITWDQLGVEKPEPKRPKGQAHDPDVS